MMEFHLKEFILAIWVLSWLGFICWLAWRNKACQ